MKLINLFMFCAIVLTSCHNNVETSATKSAPDKPLVKKFSYRKRFRDRYSENAVAIACSSATLCTVCSEGDCQSFNPIDYK
jgi:hypothetical protein